MSIINYSSSTEKSYEHDRQFGLLNLIDFIFLRQSIFSLSKRACKGIFQEDAEEDEHQVVLITTDDTCGFVKRPTNKI